MTDATSDVQLVHETANAASMHAITNHLTCNPGSHSGKTVQTACNTGDSAKQTSARVTWTVCIGDIRKRLQLSKESKQTCMRAQQPVFKLGQAPQIKKSELSPALQEYFLRHRCTAMVQYAVILILRENAHTSRMSTMWGCPLSNAWLPISVSEYLFICTQGGNTTTNQA